MLSEYEAQAIRADITRISAVSSDRFTHPREAARVTRNEKERLMTDCRNEPARGLGLALHGATCLLILVGIAMTGI